MALKAIQKKKFKKTDSNHNLLLKENLINRNFDVSETNKRIRIHSTLNYKSPEDYENERNISKLCV